MPDPITGLAPVPVFRQLGRKAWRRLRVGVARGLAAVAAVAAVAVAPAGADPRPVASPAALPERLVVVLDDNYPPYIFRNEAGEVQGILKDRWTLWQQRTGVPVELKAMDWAQAQAELLAGRAQVIDTIFQTEARRRTHSFGRPYLRIEVPIYFHRSLSGIVTLESLQGFTIGAKAGDACVGELQARGIETIKTYASYSAIVAAARDGELRVFCVDQPPARYLLHRFGIAGDYLRSVPLNTGEFHRAVRKGEEAMLAAVEAGFDQISTAELDAIDAAWFGAAVEHAAWPAWWRWAGAGVGVVLGMVLVLLAWNLSLRRSVAARTHELSRSVAALEVARCEAERSRDHLDAMLGAMPDLLFEVDAEGRYHDVRARDPSLLVAPPQALIGTLLQDHFTGANLEAAQRTIAVAVRAGTASGELLHLALAGGDRWFELSAARKRTPPGELARVMVLSRDVTARRQAELALQQREREFREFFEAGLVGMAITDAHKRWIGSNPTLASMLGHTRDELHALTWTELTHPDDRAHSEAVFGRMARGELDSATFDKRYLRRDGQLVEARVAVRCMRDDLGHAERFFVIVEDIGQRKAAELELERHRGQLEELVMERSSELVAARDQAQAASRAKSELLSRMSHELRTPMNAILGFSQLMQLDPALAPAARRHVGEILRAGQHLLALINDVLDLAHAESGHITLTPATLSAAEMLDEVATLMQPLADQRGVRLACEASDGLHAWADRTRLKQVLVNLVSNAVKYNEPGGRVELAASRTDAGMVRLTVRDDGPGIAPAKQAALFEPFNRLGAEYSTVEGTGIGLSICRRLAELMHGQIGVHSMPGAGSTFWVELPARPVPGSEVDAPQAPPAAR